MKSSPLRSSKKGGSHSRSAKKDRSRSASKVSDNSSVMVNRKFQVTEKTTQKMWKMFEQKVHGSMYGLHPAQKIKAQEQLLKDDKRFSPQERKIIRRELEKQKQSLERATKVSPHKASPLRNWKAAKRTGGNPATVNERGVDLRQTMQQLQQSSKRLAFHENTLGRGSLAEPVNLFQNDTSMHSEQYFAELAKNQAQPQPEGRPSKGSSIRVSASPLYPHQLPTTQLDQNTEMELSELTHGQLGYGAEQALMDHLQRNRFSNGASTDNRRTLRSQAIEQSEAPASQSLHPMHQNYIQAHADEPSFIETFRKPEL